MNYRDFLSTKTQAGADAGFAPLWMPDVLFDFQRLLTDWAIRRGRAAIFADCGLGKSLMELVFARNVFLKSGRPVLILAPLAVSPQLVREGRKFGIECARSLDGAVAGPITVTNYERLHYFSPDDWGGVVCDESAILKHFGGATQRLVTRFLAKIPYRLLASATPAPNDYHELGTTSEALGYLGKSDMLSRFFAQDDAKAFRMNEVKLLRAARTGSHYAKLAYRVSQQIGQWHLKAHAEGPFWRWVASWARACRMPSDLGFPDGAFVLPPLRERHHVVMPRRPADGQLFVMPAFGLREERDERRRTLKERVDLIATLADHSDPAVIWCLPTGSPVIAGDGTRRPIEKFGIGDLVLGGSGEPRRILKTWSRPFSGSLVALRVRGISDPIRLTPDHRVMTQTGWVRAGAVVPGAFLREPHTSLREGGRYLEGWLAGLYLAEGGRVWGEHGRWNRIDLSLHRDEGAFVTEQLTAFGVKHVGRYRNGPASIRLGVSDAKLRRLIEETVDGHTATDKRLRALPVEREFARGVFDGWFYGDGWAVRHSRWGQTASQDLAWQMFAIAGALGYATWIAQGINRPGPHGRAAGFEIGHAWWRISAGRFVKSTQPRRDSAGGGVWREVVSVEREPYSETVHDLTIEDDHSFLVNGIVVSNCHLNVEGDALARAIPGAVQIRGADSMERKEEVFDAFAAGAIRVLVTKPSIAGHGVNWQHCAHVVTFASHSFEDFYQSVRRCWRFGQTREVVVDIVSTEGEVRVRENLERKKKAAEDMFARLVASMMDARAARPTDGYQRAVELPPWLGAEEAGTWASPTA